MKSNSELFTENKKNTRGVTDPVAFISFGKIVFSRREIEWLIVPHQVGERHCKRRGVFVDGCDLDLIARILLDSCERRFGDRHF